MAQANTISKKFQENKFQLPFITQRKKLSAKRSAESVIEGELSFNEGRKIKLSKEFPTAFQLRHSEKPDKNIYRMRVTSSKLQQNSSALFPKREFNSPHHKEKKVGNPIAPIKNFLRENASLLSLHTENKKLPNMASLITILEKSKLSSIIKKTIEVNDFEAFLIHQVPIANSKASEEIRFWARICRKKEAWGVMTVEKVFWNNPEGSVSLLYSFPQGCFLTDILKSNFIMPESATIDLLKGILRLVAKSKFSGVLVSKITIDDLFVTNEGELKIFFPFHSLSTVERSFSSRVGKERIYTDVNFFQDFLTALVLSPMQVQTKASVECCPFHGIVEGEESFERELMMKYYSPASLNFLCKVWRGHLSFYPTLPCNSYVNLKDLVEITNSFEKCESETLERVLMNLEINRGEGLFLTEGQRRKLSRSMGISYETLEEALKPFFS